MTTMQEGTNGVNAIQKWPAPHTQALVFVGEQEAMAALMTAIAQARVSFGEVKKAREGQIGHQRFKYSPLSDLTAASVGPLSKAGVAVMQFLGSSPVEGKHRLTTIVAGHGARIETHVDFVPEKDVKEYGKQTTYLRRYTYNALFVLDGEPDADEAGTAKRQPADRPVTDGQNKTIAGMFAKLGVPPDAREEWAEKRMGKPADDFGYMDADKLIKLMAAELDGRKAKDGAP